MCRRVRVSPIFDWVIVGAGFTGATLAERIARGRNERVLIIDRRPHLGGNSHDALNEAGILVHSYGPHIFHTNSNAVWRYLQTFGAWRSYSHRVLAMIDGVAAPLPFNLNSIEKLFPRARADRYIGKLQTRFTPGARVPVLKLMKEDDSDLQTLGRFVYEKVFRHYTLKQWGLLPEELSPSVTARVPILVDRDDRYFQDIHQGIPAEGYTALFERMLDHPNICVMLSTDYSSICGRFENARIIYCGEIDAYFDYRFGALPYRSLRLSFETVDLEYQQPVATVNYPNTESFTRITEMKHLTGQTHPRTTLVTEYPTAHVPGENEPFYPVPRDETRALYNQYNTLARTDDRVIFCGRLGDYRYYNMDQAVGAALTLFEKKIGRTDFRNR